MRIGYKLSSIIAYQE